LPASFVEPLIFEFKYYDILIQSYENIFKISNDYRIRHFNESYLNLYGLNEQSKKWGNSEFINYVHNTDNNAIRTQLSHLSVYSIFADGTAFLNDTSFKKLENDLNSVKIYPNPYIPNDGNYMTGIEYNGQPGSGMYFSGLPAAATIEIYDMRGRKINYFISPANEGFIQWDVKDTQGKYVASDVYFVLFKTSSAKIIKKIIIIR